MDSNRKVSLSNNPQGKRLRGPQKKTGGGIMYRQILITAKLKTGKRGQETN